MLEDLAQLRASSPSGLVLRARGAGRLRVDARRSHPLPRAAEAPHSARPRRPARGRPLRAMGVGPARSASRAWRRACSRPLRAPIRTRPRSRLIVGMCGIRAARALLRLPATRRLRPLRPPERADARGHRRFVMQLLAAAATLAFVVVSARARHPPAVALAPHATPCRSSRSASRSSSWARSASRSASPRCSPRCRRRSPASSSRSRRSPRASARSAVFVFTRTVFRPQAGWARWLVRVAGVLLAAQAAIGVARAFSVPPSQFGNADLGFSLRQGVTAFSYAWTALEALRYRSLMVRRLALGLAEVEVANRFLLWAIAGIGAFAGSSTMSAVSFMGARPGRTRWRSRRWASAASPPPSAPGSPSCRRAPTWRWVRGKSLNPGLVRSPTLARRTREGGR